MEEDIKRLKVLLIHAENTLLDEEAIALEHLIKAYKELKEENAILKNKLLDTMKGSKIIKEETQQYIKENYIPVSLVEETIEELDEDLAIMKVDAMYGRYKEYDSKLSFEKQFSYKYGMHDVLQELLEKR